MGVGRGTRAVGARHSAWRRGRFGIVAAILFGLTAAGCSSGPQPAALGLRGPTVAFESIDGPPESIFRKLVQNPSDQAARTPIPVGFRDRPAHVRIQGSFA